MRRSIPDNDEVKTNQIRYFAVRFLLSSGAATVAETGNILDDKVCNC